MNIFKPVKFTFGTYTVNSYTSTVTFKYHVEFKYGIKKTFTDTLVFPNVGIEVWDRIPKEVLEPTLQSLLIMLGINYWMIFPTNNMQIQEFKLTKAQADFWNTVYLHGLGEYFYFQKIDFRDLIKFPYEESYIRSPAKRIKTTDRVLLLNGAGKDSILSAEILKSENISFDFFSFGSKIPQERVAKLAGVNMISVHRRTDPFVSIMHGAYPSVSTFTFTAVLVAQLLGYKSIIFSNERSADFGNLNYLGLDINHQWCKSTEAEKITNAYIQEFITPDISTYSLLRKYSELEIVKLFVQYPKYFKEVTSCNNFFHLTRLEKIFIRRNWCNRCPKCVFLFACFSAFLPKKELISMFGANLYKQRKLLRLFKRILGFEGHKPFDCVGEPEEMILSMYYALQSNQYNNDPNMIFFKENFSHIDVPELESKLF